MRLAPTPCLTGTITGMPSGPRAPHHTMRVMRQLVNAYKTDLNLIQAATSIIFLAAEKDELAEVSALYEYVRDHIRYVRDVNGVEVVADPVTTLRRMVGDCDDQTTLLATMFEAAGYPTRFVITGYNHPGIFEHIYLQVFAAGEWIDVDPTERQFLGYAPPAPVAIHFERI